MPCITQELPTKKNSEGYGHFFLSFDRTLEESNFSFNNYRTIDRKEVASFHCSYYSRLIWIFILHCTDMVAIHKMSAAQIFGFLYTLTEDQEVIFQLSLLRVFVPPAPKEYRELQLRTSSNLAG